MGQKTHWNETGIELNRAQVNKISGILHSSSVQFLLLLPIKLWLNFNVNEYPIYISQKSLRFQNQRAVKHNSGLIQDSMKKYFQTRAQLQHQRKNVYKYVKFIFSFDVFEGQTVLQI